MKLAAPRGTRDILPEESPKWQYLERVFSEVCALYQFEEIRTPTFEATEVFARGVGDASDIVRKEMYTFLDKSDRSMTLRPEGTAGVARSFIEQGMSSKPYPIRLYYKMNLFRYERVAKGRYREFHQLGLEAFGASGAEMDVEIIALLHTFFKKLGLKEMRLKINSIGTPACRIRYNEALRDYIRPHLEELCGDCRERFALNPMRMIDCKIDGPKEIIRNAPRLLDYLDEESQAHFENLKSGLDALGIAYEVDSDIVRGLDYYTKTVFEFVSDHVGTQGTICGGGRYDGLLETMGSPAIPGVGFALGVERLLMELEAQGVVLPESPAPCLYIGHFGTEAEKEATKLAFALRQEGLSVETELCGRSVKAQLKYANRRGARYVLILGEDELRSGQAQLKKMEDGSQIEIAWKNPTALLSRMKG